MESITESEDAAYEAARLCGPLSAAKLSHKCIPLRENCRHVAARYPRGYYRPVGYYDTTQGVRWGGDPNGRNHQDA